MNDGPFAEHYWSAVNKPVLSKAGEVLYIIHAAEDVTEKVAAEKQASLLKEMQRSFDLFMQAPVAVCIVSGPDYRVELANEHMLHLLGRTAAIVGKSIETSLTEARTQGLLALLDQVRTTGKNIHQSNFPAELLIDGVREQRYFDLVFQPYYQNAGDTTPTGIFCVAYNISKQIRSQRLLEEAKAETERQKRVYEAITASTPDLMYVFDLNHRFTYANEALLTMWGKTPEEAIGKGLLENGYEPWHAEMHHREIDQVAATRQSIRGEVSFPHAILGRRVYDYIFVPVVNEKGEVEAVAGTTRDITEIKKAEEVLRKSERNFRSMILQAPVAMCIMMGPEHVVDIANEAMIELWGKPKEQVLNKPIFEALPDARNQGLEAVMQNVYETGVPFFANEHPVALFRNGKWDTVYQNFVYQPYYDAEGTILGVLAISVDVTTQVLSRQKIEEIVVQRTGELAVANQALVKGNEELMRLNANLEDFAYAASHDLKEPIRKIHFFSDRLKSQLEGQLNGEQKLFFERMENASSRMASLVDDLLAYSQATKGLGEEEEVDLNKKLQLVLGDLELEVQQTKAKVVVGRLPTIHGSKRQMQQLFHNLIGNALKYSKPDLPPVVQITATEVNGIDVRQHLPADKMAKRYHLIQVSDNGIGFAQEDARRIFNVFTRLHGNAEYRGSGVGLSIAQKVVQNHGGYIWAEGIPGQGATFKILLPAE